MFVSSDAELGAQLYSVLAADFDIAVESDAAKALDDLQIRRPLALIVDENIKPMGGMKFLERAGGRLGKKMVPSLLLGDIRSKDRLSRRDRLYDQAGPMEPAARQNIRSR
jgi:hypothetical protein